MAKKTAKPSARATAVGAGGETHQVASGPERTLTTNQGTPISDNQNSLKSGERGPTLLEDFALLEKITHFDHERIPERIVHARGSGAHGFFQPTKSLSRLTKAAFLQDPKKKTEVFVRFSTVAGGAGSGDLPRDVRGFAVKFYTDEGNFDLVGNNIPVFFIQDSIKFPDLIHSVKMEPDRGYPQAASAHDTFWDFASLMPESMHMLVWVMSDRAIPRSLRMIEGFGIHTFRLINAKNESTFVKFHWRPVAGAASVIWDEAVKINGADPDFHRRDLFEAIAKGDFPEFEFAIQAFDQKTADSFDFDVLDPTKLIPEEIVPLEVIGKMTLNRNADNFFAETEQSAFHPGHVVPGIDFSNDPLLQGRIFSYTDTQLIRLGGPNFHELEINRPRCPMRNFQRDGLQRQNVPVGRVAYEPNSLAPEGPRENPAIGFATYPGQDSKQESREKLRVRPESFADHYSQARMTFRSMSEPEQRHIISAFAFELGKVETIAIRKRMLGHLMLIDKTLGASVEAALGMEGEADKITPAVKPTDMDPSPTLSLIKKAKPTLKGRKVGVLVTDGVDDALLDALRKGLEKEGAALAVIAPKAAGVKTSRKKLLPADHALSAAPSVFFDAVVLLTSPAGATQLAQEAAAVDWLRDAFGHLKIIGHLASAAPLFKKAAVPLDVDPGVVALDGRSGVAGFIKAAKQQRIWQREPTLRSPG
ncbi:MAG TPA: catalase [Bradyrhizobium sp.]|nr:catalase [Bradyrhizobium sp.]